MTVAFLPCLPDFASIPGRNRLRAVSFQNGRNIFDGAEMADNSRGDGASPVLALLVGGLIVAVAVLGYFTLTGHQQSPGTPSHITMNIKTPTPPTHP
jgi:hypothetical protein